MGQARGSDRRRGSATSGSVRRCLRSLSLGIISSMLFWFLIPPASFPRVNLFPSAGSAIAADTASPPLQKVRYTRNARIEQVDDHFVAHIYQGPIAYQDNTGQWQAIDNTLIANSDGSHYTNRANDYSVSFPESLALGPIHIQTSSGWIDLTPSATGPGVVSGATITYPITDGTIAYTAGNNEVKESISLRSPAAPSSFRTSIVTSPGISAQTVGTGAIRFSTPSDDSPFSLAAPFVADASGAASSNAVSMSIAKGSGSTDATVTVAVRSSWLSEPTRAWPVVIDPSVTIGGATQDCTLDSGNPGTSECFSTSLVVGQDPSGTATYHSLLQFSLSGAVPAGAKNATTTLSLYQYQTDGPTTIQEGQVSRAWSERGATWTTYDGTNPWTTPGGDYSCNQGVGCGSASTSSTSGWDSIPVTDGWVTGASANNGLLLKATTEAPSTRQYFYSSDYANSTYWPQLVVTYWLPQTGHRPFYTEAGSSVSDSIAIAANMESGNVTVDQSDVSMAGIGLPLEIGRTYNSANAQAAQPGAFGVGWSMDVGQDVYLAPQPDQSVNYTAPTGFTVNYGYSRLGSYVTPPGMDNTLVKNGDGSYTLTDDTSQEAFHFNSNGLLTSDVDRVGNTISYGYTQDPTCGAELTSITDTQNRTTSLTYNSNCVVTLISDPAGHTYQYGYTTANCPSGTTPHPTACLTSYTDPTNHTTYYAYATGTNNLSQVTDPVGNETKIAYAGTAQQAASFTAVTNNSTGAGLTTSFSFSNTASTVTDPKNHTTSYTFDSQGRLSSVTDPNSHTAYETWTSDDQVATTKTPSGNITTFHYDGNNSLTEIDLPNGVKTTGTYNTPSTVSGYQYLPDSATDAQGNTTHYAYYSSGLLQTVTDPSSHTQSFVYDARGRTISETDENGHTTTHTYDPTTGFPSQDTPPCPDGSTVRPCSGTQTPLGITSYSFYTTNLEHTVTNGNGKTTTFTYDAMGRVTGIGYGDGGSIGYAYDADGNLTAMTDATGTTTYTFNNLNQLTKETLPSTQSVNYGYDNAGNLTTKTDSGGTTTYGYDPANQVTSVLDRANRSYSLGYDQDGNATSLLSERDHAADEL